MQRDLLRSLLFDEKQTKVKVIYLDKFMCKTIQHFLDLIYKEFITITIVNDFKILISCNSHLC